MEKDKETKATEEREGSQVNLSRIVAKCYKENEASYKMLSACMRRNGEDETFFYFEKLV